jgi:hypothetical protein
MIVQQTHRSDVAGAPFPTQPDASDLATIAERARTVIADQSREKSSRKLRNRILVANAVVWALIIVAVRVIFF